MINNLQSTEKKLIIPVEQEKILSGIWSISSVQSEIILEIYIPLQKQNRNPKQVRHTFSWKK